MGIRRPLRFLAHKLELTEDQAAAFATILDDLKTERAQADVDRRRATKLQAEAVSGETFDADRARRAAEQRVASVQRVQGALQEALQALHGLLDARQREKLGLLIRTGPLRL
jgi:Spy/CpxP family protein refolding chaperone